MIFNKLKLKQPQALAMQNHRCRITYRPYFKSASFFHTVSIGKNYFYTNTKTFRDQETNFITLNNNLKNQYMKSI